MILILSAATLFNWRSIWRIWWWHLWCNN